MALFSRMFLSLLNISALILIGMTTRSWGSVFIQAYDECRTVDGLGEVCTPVAISGCTIPNQHFADFASCQVVRTQRPFFKMEPEGSSAPDDPRLKDQTYMKELQWITSQIRSCGCVCCHDSAAGVETTAWDLNAPLIWTDELSDRGVAILAGEKDSQILGAYDPSQNNGFDRSATGAATTDIARMKAFFKAELARREVSDEDLKKMPALGGGLADFLKKRPKACLSGEGVSRDGIVTFRQGDARYLYVLDQDAANPMFPPKDDTPEGTLWRLDVSHLAEGLQSGVRYGTTPPGSFQRVPADQPAPVLVPGETYHLYVLRDVGFPLTSCLFEY